MSLSSLNLLIAALFWNSCAWKCFVLGQELKITALQLVDADTDAPIITLTNNLVVNIALLETKSLSLQALTTNNVESVQFNVNSNSKSYIESNKPYAICGNKEHDIFTCPWLIVGTYTISATAYSENHAEGDTSEARSVRFTIVDRPANIPVKAPVNPPQAVPIKAPFPVSASFDEPIVSSCKIPKFVDPIWEAVQPAYPISVAEPHGLLIRNDIVIFSGFIKGLASVVNRTYAKDVRLPNSPWRRMEDVPIPMGITHTPTVVVDNRVFMCGGYLGGVPGPHVPYCFIYDNARNPGTGQWRRIARLPNGGSAGAGMIFDTATRTLFYAGGSIRPILGDRFSVDVDEVWKYNLDKKDLGWVASTRMPFKSNHMSSVTHKNTTTGEERHFFMGGQIGENEHTGNVPFVYEFIAKTEKWVRRASMTMGRGHAMASTRSIGCGLVIVSGSVNTVTSVKNRTTDISYYDIPTNKWTSIGDVVYGMVTPVVDVDRYGYMHFIDTRARSFRRRISF